MATQLTKREKDIFRMIQSGCQMGGKNYTKDMQRFIDNVDKDGHPVFKLNETYEKILLAAKIIAGIDNIKDVWAISSRKAGQRAVIKFAEFVGCSCEPSLRWTPGSLTNYITKNFKEPKLIIVVDPYTDAKAIKESSYCNIPVIALCNSRSSLKFVDVAIPCNNQSTQSISMIFWLLGREVCQLKGTRTEENWDSIRVELFYAKSDKKKDKTKELLDKNDEEEELKEGDENEENEGEQAADDKEFDDANN